MLGDEMSRVTVSKIVAVLALAGCAGKASLDLVETQTNPEYGQPAAEAVAVMALYPDDEFEVRALMENSFTQRLTDEGVQASPGYRYFDKYQGLLDGVGVDAAAQILLDDGIDAVLFIDPIRAKAFDPGEYAERRSAYRALGLDSSASISLFSQIAAEADAAEVIMQVSLWSPSRKEFGWAGTYEINAPQGYDTEVAKTYVAEFATAVAEQLRQDGYLK